MYERQLRAWVFISQALKADVDAVRFHGSFPQAFKTDFDQASSVGKSLRTLGNKHPGPKLPLVHHRQYSLGHLDLFAAPLSLNVDVGITPKD